MGRKEEVEDLSERLSKNGFDYETAKKNLLQTDSYFREELKKYLDRNNL